MLTNYQQFKNNMYDIIFKHLNDVGIVIVKNDETNKTTKYILKGMYYAPNITPNIGDINTEIIEPQFIIKSQSLNILNQQLAPNKLSTNDIILIQSGDSYINNELFKIVKIEPDNYGLIVLILRKTDFENINNEIYTTDYGDTV